MPKRDGQFGQRHPDFDFQARSWGGWKSWLARQKKPDELDRLKAMGAKGGRKGGGRNRST